MPLLSLRRCGWPGAQHGRSQQRQAVIAKIHVIADKEGGRTESTAPDRFVGVGLELLLDVGSGDACQKSVGIDADLPAEGCQHLILRDILVLAEIGGKYCFDKG